MQLGAIETLNAQPQFSCSCSPASTTARSSLSCALNAPSDAGQGRVVIDRFVEHDLPRVLSDQGVCLLLLLDVNNVRQVTSLIQQHGLFCKTLISRVAGGEKLLVVDIRRRAHDEL
jgi:hypothetical protein